MLSEDSPVVLSEEQKGAQLHPLWPFSTAQKGRKGRSLHARSLISHCLPWQMWLLTERAKEATKMPWMNQKVPDWYYDGTSVSQSRVY